MHGGDRSKISLYTEKTGDTQQIVYIDDGFGVPPEKKANFLFRGWKSPRFWIIFYSRDPIYNWNYHKGKWNLWKWCKI